jgi:hypothetical protein
LFLFWIGAERNVIEVGQRLSSRRSEQ